MSNGVANLVRRPISERTTTTILRQRHTASAVAGATAASVLVGPVVGKRWLIVDAVVSVSFQSNPGGSDAGAAFGEILNGALPVIVLVGRNASQPGRQAPQFGQLPPGTTLGFGDEVRIFVDALTSVADIDGILTFWGFEYDDLT